MQNLNGLIFKPTEEEASARLRDTNMDCLVPRHSHGRLEREGLVVFAVPSSHYIPVASLSGFSRHTTRHISCGPGTVLLSPSLLLAQATGA